ncbi:hypothetical protein ACJIZ3_024935 [Penstemon smallii]|uniref:RBR-type E3 ubiquitin transferase n=1 Tax=Penstemon smallii TaxID=265156 RepID=A0ABD3TT81_9LAMI
MEEDYVYVSNDDESCNQGYDDDECEVSRPNGEVSSFKVITKESLLAAQKDELQRVMDLLSLKEHHARTLLIHHCWDFDSVSAVFVEKGKERLYAEAGVPVEDIINLNSSQIFSKILCETCYDEFPANETTIMECGHCFCNECWTEHFIVKINEGKSRRITCMAHKCYSICDEGYIRDLVSSRDQQLAEKFDCFLLESYIEDNKRVKWCPSVPNCGNAIRVEDDYEYCEVECACGLQFCFSCSSEAHSPSSCLMWKSWVKMSEDKTTNWMVINPVLYPKCHNPVEKMEGCNLKLCICGQTFCWLCGGAIGPEYRWDTIANHKCGLYEKEATDVTKTFWRYKHYFKRFEAHMDSLKAEDKLKEKFQQKIVNLVSRELVVKDFSWVSDGLNFLTRSRRILSYSIPFAYFVFGDELFKIEMSSNEMTIKQNLFEDQQHQLEVHVERLKMFLEKLFAEYSEENLLKTRLEVINISKVVDNLCKKLYDCIENELLGPLQQATYRIAPYRSNDVEKAAKLVQTSSL